MTNPAVWDGVRNLWCCRKKHQLVNEDEEEAELPLAPVTTVWTYQKYTTRREQIEYSRHLIGYLSMSVYVCIRLSLCVLHIKAANFAMMTVKTILQKSLIKREMIPILFRAFRVYFLLNAISWRKFTQPLPNSECFSAIETSHYLQCQCHSLQKTASLLQCQWLLYARCVFLRHELRHEADETVGRAENLGRLMLTACPVRHLATFKSVLDLSISIFDSLVLILKWSLCLNLKLVKMQGK